MKVAYRTEVDGRTFGLCGYYMTEDYLEEGQTYTYTTWRVWECSAAGNWQDTAQMFVSLNSDTAEQTAADFAGVLRRWIADQTI